MDNEIIEQIVSKAAQAVYARMQDEKAEKPQIEEQTQPEPTRVYGIAIKRRFLWPKRHQVISHIEERFLQAPDGTFVQCEARLVLTLPNGTRIAVPNIANKTYSIYPL